MSATRITETRIAKARITKAWIALASLLMLTGVAHAQAPASPPQPAEAAAPPAGGDKAGAAAGQSGTSDFANQQTYKTKDGGMYQPPAKRPASPAQDLSVYGRT